MTIRVDIHITPLGRARVRTLKGAQTLFTLGIGWDLDSPTRPVALTDDQLDRLVSFADKAGIRVDRL